MHHITSFATLMLCPKKDRAQHSRTCRRYLKLECSLWYDLIARDRPALAHLFLLTGFSHDFLADLTEQEIEASASSTLDGTNWEGLARRVELDLTLDTRAQVSGIICPTLVVGGHSGLHRPVETSATLG